MNGMADEENNIPISHDTIFAQFSMTKPLVSAAILQLIEDGKIDIDDKLEDFYPAFSSMMVAPDGYFERNNGDNSPEVDLVANISEQPLSGT